MRIHSVSLTVAAVIALNSGVQMSFAADPQSPASGLGVKVVITLAKVTSYPAKPTPEWFECTSEITDLASGKRLASPHLRFKKGESANAKMKSEDPDSKSEYMIDMQVYLNENATVATFSIMYTKGGKLVSSQTGSLSTQ